MFKKIYCCLMMLGSSAFAAQEHKLTVAINGLKPAVGSVYVAVYNREDGWLKDQGSFKSSVVTAKEAELKLEFLLPQGAYAVQVFQDLNSNGKLDMRWLPPGPDEPWGVSNNRTDRIGPPRYKDAEFEITAEKEVMINLVQI